MFKNVVVVFVKYKYADIGILWYMEMMYYKNV